MNKLLITVISASLVFNLSACGGNKSRVFNKQRTPTDIKIDNVDLSTNFLQLRFSYRSYVEKTLNNINCEVDFNTESSFNINKVMTINLGAFATEVISFEGITINNKDKIMNSSTLDYSLLCHIDFNHGQEVVRESSILHLIPGEKSSYR